MDFKYLAHADRFVGLNEAETPCDICGESKKCFDATGWRGTETLNVVCPDCLANGKLSGRDIRTCEGDIGALRQQLMALNSGMPWIEVDRTARQKTEELEKTTPGLVTWQDWEWPCADGDYCQFIGFGSVPMYNRLAKPKKGKKLFADSLYESIADDSDPDELWDDCMPDKEISNYGESSQYSTLFYVFKSLHSERIVTIWDAE